MKLFVTCVLFASCLFSAHVSMAQTSDAPIEITADKTLEWHRGKNQYVANGNAAVKQGTTTIRGASITADYRKGETSDTEIYRMTAKDAVSIEDSNGNATGDLLVYEVDSGIATMTGKSLKMTSPEQTVTATDKFEYHMNTGRLNAIGNAKVISGEHTLTAHQVSAFIGKEKTGKQSVDKMEATGRVKIVTPDETLTGDRATYDAKNRKAIVVGNVKILRGQNELTGERAEVDLATNISKLFGNSIEDGQVGGGRVRGVFYPSSKGQ